MSAAEEADPCLIAVLPEALLAEVLEMAAAGDAAQLCSLALVCKAWRDAVSLSWRSLCSISLVSPGGRLRPAASLTHLRVGPLAGLSSGLELQTLCRDSLLLHLTLHESALAQPALASLLQPTLTSLDASGSRLDAVPLLCCLRRGRLLQLALSHVVLSPRTAPLPVAICRCTALTRLELGASSRLGCVLDATAVSLLASSLPLLQHLDVSGSEALTYIPLPVLRLARLRSLLLDDCALSGSATAAELELAHQDGGTCFTSLSVLCLSGCRGLRSAGVRALAFALGRATAPVTQLRLGRMLDLEDADAARLISAARQRGESRLDLDVSGSGRLSSLFSAEMCQHRLSNMRASGLSLFSADMLATVAASGALAGCSAIELADCERLGPRLGGAAASCAIEAACASAERALRTLVLDGCELDDDAAVSIAGACPHLDTLSLVGVPGLGDVGLGALARLPALTSLTLGGRARWTPVALSGCGPLRSLRVVRCGRLNEADLVEVAAAAGASLRRLCIAACGALTDDGLARLASLLPQLRSLSLHAEDHPSLRGASLHRFVALRSLTLRGCPAIEVAGIQRLLASVPDLAELSLPHDLHTKVCVPLRAEPELENGWRPRPRLRLN